MEPEEVPPIERREAPRFPVTLAVRFNEGQGWTRDVSASGMYFTTEWPFRVGAPIRFTLVLDRADPQARKEVTCEGVVVRVEPGAEAHGVAVSIDSYDIDSLRDPIGVAPPE